VYYKTLKDRDKALKSYLKACDLNPMEPDVHQFLANIYREQGNISQSAQEMSLYEDLRHH
jgi:tetratricopeptide (TPR) repeat protein